MPSYNTHKKIGMIASFLVGFFVCYFMWDYVKTSLTYKLIFAVPIVIFYSNFCDLDHHMSRLRKKTLRMIFFVMALSAIVSFFVDIKTMILILSITGLLGIGLLKLPHRGLLHTYWFAFIASLPVLYVHWFLFILAVTCSFSHIFIDRLFSSTKRKVKKIFGISGNTYHHYWHIKL